MSSCRPGVRALSVLLVLVMTTIPSPASGDVTAAAPATRPAPARDPNLPTLWIVGDSTVRNNTPGQMGWGDPIAELFDRSRINVVNRAIGGRSSRTFQTDGRWDQLLAEAKRGDFVLIQFGHNDGAPLDDDKRARGTIRGTGEESKEIYNPITKKQEVVHTYGWYMRKYVTDAQAVGMTPIVLSYVPRCPRPGGALMTPTTAPTSYALWARESAEAAGGRFVDLFGILWAHYATMTPEQVKSAYFCDADFTHTNEVGARRNAEAVVEGLRQLPDCPLAGYLVAESRR
jgi:rhamnogalacturonan acetylesterase